MKSLLILLVMGATSLQAKDYSCDLEGLKNFASEINVLSLYAAERLNYAIEDQSYSLYDKEMEKHQKDLDLEIKKFSYCFK